MADINCQYNSGIICRERARCAVCGWNPEVTECRKSKLQAPNKPKSKKKSRPSGANTGSGNLRAHNYQNPSR